MSLPLLQLPKTQTFFGGMCADEGKSIIGLDFAALEPHVSAFMSRDPRMLQLYGPNAKPNDIYIFFGSSTKQYGQLFRSKGYDPDNPTKEAISRIKAECDTERQVCKKLVLGCIAEGTLVRVKGLGHVPIEKITENMLVWDGSSWVKTSGAIFKGVKDCINFNEGLMTYDHRIKTKSGWDLAERANPEECLRPEDPGYSWAEVWGLVCNIVRSTAYKWVQIYTS